MPSYAPWTIPNWQSSMIAGAEAGLSRRRLAQQEGERFFERAPEVSLVCGSASYPRLPELLKRLERMEKKLAAAESTEGAGDGSTK